MMNGLGNLGHLGKLGHASTSGTNHPEVEASGRAFPIWNTKLGDDKLLSLSIHGLTEQNGTPTPANPVPMRSVGDSGLFLSVMPDKAGSDYQLLNIKEAMKKAGHDGILRSVNGIYDEVVYNGKEWKLIQRIQNEHIITCTSVSNHADLGFCDCYFSLSKMSITGYNISSNYFVPGTSKIGIIQVVSTGGFGSFTLANNGGDFTLDDANQWLSNHELEVIYILRTPAEYPLDLPVITTYDEQTYFASNAAEVKPRMVAQCKVSKALDYIREGLIGYYTGRGRSNTDENKNILPDLSGNGNDLENKNFAYTVDSGYGDGYIQYDGVDDFSYSETLNTDINVHIHCVCSNYSTLISNKTIWGSGSSSGIIARLYCNSRSKIEITPGSSVSWLNGDSYANSSGTPTDKLSIWSANVHPDRFRLNLGTLQDNNQFFGKVRIHDVLMYDRYLDEEEVQHNYKVSCQYNGENIDGKAEETTASGENGFTIYNSLPGIFEELTVYGKSIQDGTPTPENPIPINSVGDTPLILTISNGTETQQINFGDIKLRSVGTVSDELVFDNSIGKWKLIQRIKEYSVDDLSTPGNYSLKKFESGDDVQYAIYYNTSQIDLVSSITSPFMSDYSDKSFWPGIAHKGVGYYYGQLCFSMLNGEMTEAEALNITKGRHYQGLLITPIETELDFESPKTFSGEVTVTTNQETALPYMTARAEVWEKLTLPDSPLAVYIAGKQTTGEKVFKDQSGNGNDIPLFNIAHSSESGFFQGALRLDGVDDTGRLPLESFNPKITAETSFFFSGNINKNYGVLNTLKDNKEEQIESVSTVFINETGKAICYYPIDRISEDNVNILGTPTIIYLIPSLQALDILLSEENNTYFTLSGMYFGNRLQDLTEFDYRYLMIYPRNLTSEEQAIVLKYIKQGIYEL